MSSRERLVPISLRLRRRGSRSRPPANPHPRSTTTTARLASLRLLRQPLDEREHLRPSRRDALRRDGSKRLAKASLVAPRVAHRVRHLQDVQTAIVPVGLSRSVRWIVAYVSRGGDGARAAEGFGDGGGERVRRAGVGAAERVEVEERVVRAVDAAEVREEAPVRAAADAGDVGVVVDLRTGGTRGRGVSVCSCSRGVRVCRRALLRGGGVAVAGVGGEGRTWKRTVVASWARRGRRTSATSEGGMFATRNVTAASTRATSSRGSVRR